MQNLQQTFQEFSYTAFFIDFILKLPVLYDKWQSFSTDNHILQFLAEIKDYKNE